MPDIYQLSERFKRDLLRSERRAASEMVRAYGVAWQRIRERINDLTKSYYEALANGEAVSPSWLHEQQRLSLLQQQVEREIRAFAKFSEGKITAQQLEAIQAAQAHAPQLIDAALPPGVNLTLAHLPTGALQSLVGYLSDGTPLSDLLNALGKDASQKVRDELIAGLAVGHHPTVIARRIRAALGENMVRALRISRTETLRAYREATRSVYQANANILTGWRWQASHSTRTCISCLLMDGTIHPLDEPMASHVNCRCAMVPILRSHELPPTKTGEEYFEGLDDDGKRTILGPAKLLAYQRGRLKLPDLLGTRHSDRWGDSVYERSLREIVGARTARALSREAIATAKMGAPH